jgi:enoyl-CoA hydratase/carnithine racemase
MDTREVLYDVADRVATVTLNRPDKPNAFTRRVRDELINCFERADAGDDARSSNIIRP